MIAEIVSIVALGVSYWHATHVRRLVAPLEKQVAEVERAYQVAAFVEVYRVMGTFRMTMLGIEKLSDLAVQSLDGEPQPVWPVADDELRQTIIPIWNLNGGELQREDVKDYLTHLDTTAFLSQEGAIRREWVIGLWGTTIARTSFALRTAMWGHRSELFPHLETLIADCVAKFSS